MNLKPNIMKPFFFAALVLLLFAFPKNGLGQKKINPEHYGGRDTDSVPVYSYQVKRNRPDSVARLTICANGWAVANGGLNLNALGSSLRYDYRNNVTFFGDFFIGLDQSNYSNNYPHLSKLQGILEVGGTWFFSNKIKEKYERTYYNIPNGGSAMTKDSIKRVRKFGFTSSLNFLNAALSTSLGNFVGYDLSDPAKGRVDFNSSQYNSSSEHNYGNLGTYVSAGYFAFGIETESIKDISVLIEKYGKEEMSNKNRFYADLLVCPLASYDNILVPSDYSLSGDVLNLNKYTQKQYFGFRAGWDFYSLRKLGLSMGIEAGYIPNASYYFFAKFGVALNFKRSNLTK